MIKKYIIAIATKRVNGNQLRVNYPLIEIVFPEKEFDTFEEAESCIENMLTDNTNKDCKFVILPQYTNT